MSNIYDFLEGWIQLITSTTKICVKIKGGLWYWNKDSFQRKEMHSSSSGSSAWKQWKRRPRSSTCTSVAMPRVACTSAYSLDLTKFLFICLSQELLHDGKFASNKVENMHKKWFKHQILCFCKKKKKKK